MTWCSRFACAFVVMLLVFGAASVRAQERGFSVPRGDATIAGTSTFLVERPWYSSDRRFSVGLTADYAHLSLVPRTGGGSFPPILEHALLGRLDAAFSLFDRFTLFASVPLALLERGNQEPLSQVSPLGRPALGDPRVGLFLRVFGSSEHSPLSGHLGADVWIPIGVASTHQGDLGVRVMPRVVVAGALGWLRYSVEGGFLYRTYSTLGPPAEGLVAASEARAGVSLGLALAGGRIYFGPEARFSSQVLGEKAFTQGGMSLEVLGGASFLIANHLRIGVSGGKGFFEAAGTPDLRGYLKVAWAPMPVTDEEPVAPLPELTDNDGDWIADEDDRCPHERETFNGVRDSDGCPEFEMEEDAPLARILKPAGAVGAPPRRALSDAGVAPAQSPALPIEPKTSVVPQQTLSVAPAPRDAGVVLGSPTPPRKAEVPAFDAGVWFVRDSDGDGPADDLDRCPLTAEDLDGFEDDDGCPELDNDGDLIVDGADQCPLEGETFNGAADEDGCPDEAPDADRDLVADAVDRCPNEPESRDGLRDEDGCPEYVPVERASFAQLSAVTSTPKEAALSAMEPARVVSTDLDQDGIIDGDDRCPLTPEDADAFEDGDGCPEPDNDGDGVWDPRDRCPDAAETIDGYEDDDGCPDEGPDIDSDGVEFVVDRCPLEPGDRTDGCPHLAPPALALADVALERGAAPVTSAVPSAVGSLPVDADFDRDAIADAVDRCPTSREDLDGFEDEDGCPEPDNDHDGLDDGKDRCPLEAETINGNKDEDGCPDVGVGVVTVTKDEVVIRGTIQFKLASAQLRPSATPLLKQVAATLRANPAISVEIQGHTDDAGSAAKNIVLSQKRAETIRAFLIKAGVPASRLVALGYGPTRPRASNKTAAGREQNRRVEFKILGEPK